MERKISIEVCAFHSASCLIAEKAGAVRVELCDNPLEGGTTPSYGMIKQAREKISIQLYPIIRPRAGSFYYSKEEYAIIKEDILMCRQLGCDGISVGAQTAAGTIDTEMMKRIVEWAGPMGVTCNRVFDITPDPFVALEDLIHCGCERILTSGQKTSAPEGTALLKQLVGIAGNKIMIMPGAGVKSSNIVRLIQETGAQAFHTSARIKVAEKVICHNPSVSDYGNIYLADENELRKIVQLATYPESNGRI